MFNRESALRLFSDLHKDAYGYRPSVDLLRQAARWDDAYLEIEWNRMCAMVERNIAEERAAQERAAEKFETLVRDTIALGAGNRQTAIRWIVEAEDADDGYGMEDLGYLEYKMGLRYGYLRDAQ